MEHDLNEQQGPYEPIDCAFHDELVSWATLQRPVEIVYKNQTGDKLRHKAALPTCSRRTVRNTSGCKAAKSFVSTCSPKCGNCEYAATAYPPPLLRRSTRNSGGGVFDSFPWFAFRSARADHLFPLNPFVSARHNIPHVPCGKHVDRLHFDRFIAELVQTAQVTRQTGRIA